MCVCVMQVGPSNVVLPDMFRNIDFVGLTLGELEEQAYSFYETDVVFGVDTLHFLDSAAKRYAFLNYVSESLSEGGRLVIIDEFKLHLSPPRLLQLLERGMGVEKLHRKVDWVEAAMATNRLKLVVDVDLTPEAMHYWEVHWRFVHVMLHFRRLVQLCVLSWANLQGHYLLSFATNAHAFRTRAAEYGMLVFQKHNSHSNATHYTP